MMKIAQHAAFVFQKLTDILFLLGVFSEFYLVLYFRLTLHPPRCVQYRVIIDRAITRPRCNSRRQNNHLLRLFGAQQHHKNLSAC